MSFDFSKFAPAASASTPAAGVLPPPAVPPPATAPVGPPPAAAPVMNPYGNIDEEEVNDYASAPLCKNIRRDQSLPKERNMVGWEPATYILGIKGVEYKKVITKKGKKVPVTEIKAVVLAGDGDSPVGSDVSIAIFESQYSGKEIKKFVVSVENCHKSTPIGHQAAMMIHPSQPYAGKIVGIVVDSEKGKPGSAHEGKDFSRNRFFPAGVTGQDEAGKPVFGPVTSNTGL